MDALNLPIQMICICAADGAIKPIRFRLEDSEYQIQTISICKVLSCKEIRYVGIEAFVYVCSAIIEGQEKQFELRYTIRTHSWVLFRIIY